MPTFSYSNADYTSGQLATAAIFNTRFTDLLTFLNTTKLDALNLQDGAVTTVKLSTAVQDALGLNGAATHRGKSIIAGVGTRTNTAFGALNNGPDQVASVAVPANALVRVRFYALGKSTGSSARAALFIGANQLVVPSTVTASTAPQTEEADFSTSNLAPIVSTPIGLVGQPGHSSDATTVTTGEALGMVTPSGNGPVWAVAGTLVAAPTDQMTGGVLELRNLPAATYTFSVQFKSATGTVSVQNRELYVEVVSF